jgi:hypothetical protein
MKIDAQTICRQLLFVHREEEALVEHDPYAPEEGTPNHARHETLLAEEAALLAALAKVQPRTRQGVRALAEVAMTFLDAERSPKDHRFAPEDIVQWVTFVALTNAAGRPEAIPLPKDLPVYWPA